MPNKLKLAKFLCISILAYIYVFVSSYISIYIIYILYIIHYILWNTLTALKKNYKFVLYCMTQGVQYYSKLFTRYMRIKEMPKPYPDDYIILYTCIGVVLRVLFR